MSKFYKILILSLLTLPATAQSWQWGKRGGGASQINEVGGKREQVLSIVTDSEKNIYALSIAGGGTINVGGLTYSGLDFNAQIGDVSLSSFACDGTHRWTKIIGSNGYDYFESLQIDNQENVYVGGHFGTESGPTYPQLIGLDHTFATNPVDERRITIMKFSGNGDLVWFKKVQSPGISQADAISSGVQGFALEDNGTSYMLALLSPGIYADGAFITATPGTNYYILKYGSNGNFISGMSLDMHFPGSTSGRLEFYRNKYNGNFYFTGRKQTTQDATVGGQILSKGTYMFSFSATGEFLWKKESTSNSSGTIFFYNLDFDSENNIYIGGRMIGINAESFLGYSIAFAGAPTFVMKTNPTADGNIWATSNNGNFANDFGAIRLNGNEVAVSSAGYGTAFTWGNQTINVNPANSGSDVLLSRIDKNSGQCISMHSIASSANSNDFGTAIAVDSSGDYIVGGAFEGTLSLNSSASLVNIGSQSDFFVAKFASSLCSPLSSVEFGSNRLKVYPNPARETFNLLMEESSSYTIYNMSGQMLKKGKLDSGDNTVDIRDLPSGFYIVMLENSKKENFKLIVE